jgi:hypothetical protein
MISAVGIRIFGLERRLQLSASPECGADQAATATTLIVTVKFNLYIINTIPLNIAKIATSPQYRILWQTRYNITVGFMVKDYFVVAGMGYAMRYIQHLLFYILVVSVVGCAIHPLPDDISRETTYSIIHNIRCEARAEIKSEVQALLMTSSSASVRAIDAEDVLENLDKIRKLDQDIGDKINKYRLSAIGYLFTFKITENNDAKNGKVNFILPLTDGLFTLDFEGGVEKKRDSDRKIGIVETFEELDGLDCTNVSHPESNLAYPITGSVGMAEVVDSFLKLAESVGSNKKFNDTLTYTTEIKAGVNPKLELKPVDNRFRLKTASANFDVSRKDVHELYVTLTFPVEPPADDKAVRKFVSPKGLRSLAEGPPEEIVPYTDETKKKAAEELCIQQALIREQQTGIVRLEAPEEYCKDDYSRY